MTHGCCVCVNTRSSLHSTQESAAGDPTRSELSKRRFPRVTAKQHVCCADQRLNPPGGTAETNRGDFVSRIFETSTTARVCLQYYSCGAVCRASRAGAVSIPFVGCPQAVLRVSKDYHRGSRSRNVARFLVSQNQSQNRPLVLKGLKPQCSPAPVGPRSV